MSSKEIIALNKQIEDDSTGAISSHHVLDSYYVSKLANITQGTFATYVSQKTLDAGKQPVSRHITIQINQLPPKGQDIEQWLYLHAAAPAAENEPNPSVLAGATPIYPPATPA